MTTVEDEICRRLIEDAIGKGYKISSFDGEEWQVKQSDSIDEVMSCIDATGEAYIRIRDGEKALGGISLIFGNGTGCDLISDYTASPLIEEIVKGAMELADEIVSMRYGATAACMGVQ